MLLCASLAQPHPLMPCVCSWSECLKAHLNGYWEKKKNRDRLIIKITVGIKNDILQKETQHQEIKCSNNTQASLRSSLSL